MPGIAAGEKVYFFLRRPQDRPHAGWVASSHVHLSPPFFRMFPLDGVLVINPCISRGSIRIARFLSPISNN